MTYFSIDPAYREKVNNNRTILTLEVLYFCSRFRFELHIHNGCLYSSWEFRLFEFTYTYLLIYQVIKCVHWLTLESFDFFKSWQGNSNLSRQQILKIAKSSRPTGFYAKSNRYQTRYTDTTSCTGNYKI